MVLDYHRCFYIDNLFFYGDDIRLVRKKNRSSYLLYIADLVVHRLVSFTKNKYNIMYYTLHKFKKRQQSRFNAVFNYRMSLINLTNHLVIRANHINKIKIKNLPRRVIIG